MLTALAWRNLFRSLRRTGLTVGAIAFAIMLMTFAICMNEGSYDAMIDGGTRMGIGHLQVHVDGYHDQPRIRDRLRQVAALADRVAAVPGVVAVLPRAEAFAVASAGEVSSGALVQGIDAELEHRHMVLPELLVAGRWLADGDPPEAVLGAALARNIGLGVGDEVVVLGADPEGSVAALALTIVGLIDSGQAELDRVLVQVPLGQFQDGFWMPDSAHRLLVFATEPAVAPDLARRLSPLLPTGVVSASWRQLMPDIRQAIEFDRLNNSIFLTFLGVMVVFGVVNTFMMIMFERTREFGVLMALGIRPWTLVGLLQLEAALLSVLGVMLGWLLALGIVGVFAWVGIGLGEEGAALMDRFQLPDRIYPGFAPVAFWLPALCLCPAVQLAALFPALRLRRLDPVEALDFE